MSLLKDSLESFRDKLVEDCAETFKDRKDLKKEAQGLDFTVEYHILDVSARDVKTSHWTESLRVRLRSEVTDWELKRTNLTLVVLYNDDEEFLPAMHYSRIHIRRSELESNYSKALGAIIEHSPKAAELELVVPQAMSKSEITDALLSWDQLEKEHFNSSTARDALARLYPRFAADGGFDI